MDHLSSKTMVGLGFLILVAVGASFMGKLTPELVEVIKWVGGSFMAVRVVANAVNPTPVVTEEDPET